MECDTRPGTESSLSLRISPVRDGAGQEPGFHPKGRPFCFARVFPGHGPLILPGGLQPMCRWSAATAEDGERIPGWGWALPRGPSRTPRPSGPRARCAPGAARVPALCAVPSASPPRLPPNPRARDLGEALATQLGIVNPLPSRSGPAPRLSTPPFLPVRLPRRQEDLAAGLARG